MKSSLQATTFKILAIFALGGSATQILADDCSNTDIHFKEPRNYCGNAGLCTVQPGTEKMCRYESNGNHYLWGHMNPFDHNVYYTANGSGFFTDPVPKMTFSLLKSDKDASRVKVRSSLVSPFTEWGSSEAYLDENGTASLPRGTNGNYYYKLYMKNNTDHIITVRYHICDDFYGGGLYDGEYCGNFPQQQKDVSDSVAVEGPIDMIIGSF